MDNQPLVTVIMPVYNVENYLLSALNSVIQQTYHNLEIIVIDDGSTDTSKSIIEAIAQTDQRVQLISLQNGGAANARNVGLKHANGEWIYFADSDDVLDENLIQRVVLAATDAQVELVAFGYRNISSPVVKKLPQLTAHNQSEMEQVVKALRHNFLFPFLWNKLYKMKIIHDCQLNFVGKIGEDERFNKQYILAAKSATLIEDVLYNYRQGRPGSLMQTQANSIDTDQELEARFEAKFPDAEIDLLNQITAEFIRIRNATKHGARYNRTPIKIKFGKLIQMQREIQIKYLLIKHPALIKLWIMVFER
ncbi:MAG: glycosyltransferase family 2 protein [Lactobacillaceae bacterium]|jgi:glycosyltransferase involved in cell wall biosynthesis|nr:glycosyltransferase family 2 protein [Lactobacillaceae bacterium]